MSVAVTETPGNTDLVSSVTVPTTDTFCAYAIAVMLNEHATRNAVLRMLRTTCLLGRNAGGRRRRMSELASILVPVSIATRGLFLSWRADGAKHQKIECDRYSTCADRRAMTSTIVSPWKR